MLLFNWRSRVIWFCIPPIMPLPNIRKTLPHLTDKFVLQLFMILPCLLFLHPEKVSQVFDWYSYYPWT